MATNIHTQCQQDLLPSFLIFCEDESLYFVAGPDDVMVGQEGEQLILFGEKEQFSDEVFELIWDFDAELIGLPDAFDEDVGECFFGDERVDGERVEEVGIELGDGHYFAFVVDAFLVFDKDILPDSAEVDRLYGKQVFSEPADDLHFAVRTVVEKLEHHHLVLQKMEDYP